MTDRSSTPPYRHDARIEFVFADPDVTEAVERSIAPEIDGIDDDRSRAAVARAGTTLTIDIDAADLVALRAATNTWTTFVDVAVRTLGHVDDGSC